MSLTKVSYSMISGASVNVADFGATGDGVTDDYPAIQAAIDYLRLAVIANGANHVGGFFNAAPYTMYFPAGKYMSSKPLVFDFIVRIQGSAGGTYGSYATSIWFTTVTAGLVFLFSNAGVYPIYDYVTNTVTSLSATAGTPGQILNGSPATGTAADSEINNITLRGSGSTGVFSTLFSGIESRCALRMKMVFVLGFKGSGIRFFGNTSGITAYDYGGADNIGMYDCHFEQNDGHGLFLEGGDANIGIFSNCQFTSNVGWGVYDNSSLGNTYISGQSSYNLGYGTVELVASCSGTNLTVTALAHGSAAPHGAIMLGSVLVGVGITLGTTIVSQTSGTTGSTGVYVVSNAATVSSTNMITKASNGGSYGSFYPTGISLFLNVYSEDGIRHVGRDALFIGGNALGGYEGPTTGYPPNVIIGGRESGISQMRTVFKTQPYSSSFTVAPDSASTFFNLTDTVYQADGSNIALAWRNLGATPGDCLTLSVQSGSYNPYWVSQYTGANKAQYGSGADQLAVFTVPVLGLYDRRVHISDSVPTSLSFGRGDLIINRNVSAGGTPSWVCTTAGIAGSTAVFKEMANVAA